MLSGEPELTAWVLPKTSLNATVPFLLFSYWQIILPLLRRWRFSVPDISGVLHKPKHRQDRERVFYMNEITIAVKYDNDNPTVSGRELHAILQIDTPYRIWFPRMCECGFVEGRDFNPYKNVRVQNEGYRNVTREVADHQLTIDMAKELCMIQRTEIGKRCREYFLNLEKQWNSPDAVMARALQIADQRLELAKQQNGSLIETTAIQAKQIEEMKPKATYYDKVLKSEGLMPISTIAKDYGKSAVWLNRWLHNHGIQYKQGDIWLLYQKYADKGYVKSKTYTVKDGNGDSLAKLHTNWTQAGRLFIYELLKAEGILPLIEQDDS